METNNHSKINSTEDVFNSLKIRSNILSSKQKKYLQAIPFYNRSIKQDKKNVNVWNSNAVTLYKLKKYPQALICCRKAVKLGTKDKETLSCFEKIKTKLNKPS